LGGKQCNWLQTGTNNVEGGGEDEVEFRRQVAIGPEGNLCTASETWAGEATNLKEKGVKKKKQAKALEVWGKRTRQTLRDTTSV